MEVDRTSFQSCLLEILENIAKAHFVAFDLELSGIHRQPHRPSNSRRKGKQTLQQRYTEVKDAAETYTILQVGITCIEENSEDGIYIARPYNFNLNPLVVEKLDIERTISFQSGAMVFLIEHGFQVDLPFRLGVPYLSRHEESEARKNAQHREDGAGFVDVDLKKEDVESLNFMRRTRKEITAWVARTGPQPDYLNIAPEGFGVDPKNMRGLSNYQKKLVHQLVRAEFSDLVTISRPLFIQVIARDEQREDAIKKGRRRRLEEQLSRQIGLRWLFEAMCGGDLSGLNAADFARTATSEAKFVDKQAISDRFDALKLKLKHRPTVLVGHNLFTDLIYMHRLFLGDLPERVEDFQSLIHGLFPVIVDTKYLATHECLSVNPKSSLDEIEEDLRSEQVPVIMVDTSHAKYVDQEAAHEAGYDSYLTAVVMTKLSTRLEAEGACLVNESPSLSDGQYYDAVDDGGVLLDGPRIAKPSSAASSRQVDLRGERSSTSKAHTLHEVTNQRTSVAQPKNSSGRPTSSSSPAFSRAGRFDALIDLSSSNDLPRVGGSSAGHDSSGPSSIPTDDIEDAQSETPSLRLMPPFDTRFWKVYGNKLRVFGTQEEICDLSPY